MGWGAPVNMGVTTTAAATGFWATTVLVLIAMVIGYSVRILPGDERAVVRRWGRVTRTHGPGVAVRLPLLETVTTVSLREVYTPLVVRASSADGVPVRLLGGVTSAVTRAADSVALHTDPHHAATLAVQRTLAEKISGCRLAALPAVRARWEDRLPAEMSRTTLTWGVRVIEVEITGIETWLTQELLDRVHRS